MAAGRPAGNMRSTRAWHCLRRLQHALYPVSADVDQATSLADHHGGSLDDRPSIITHPEIKIGNGLVGNGGRDDEATANIDANMGRRGALRHIDNLSLELIACAEFHKNVPFLCQNRDSIAPSISIMRKRHYGIVTLGLQPGRLRADEERVV